MEIKVDVKILLTLLQPRSKLWKMINFIDSIEFLVKKFNLHFVFFSIHFLTILLWMLFLCVTLFYCFLTWLNHGFCLLNLNIIVFLSFWLGFRHFFVSFLHCTFHGTLKYFLLTLLFMKLLILNTFNNFVTQRTFRSIVFNIMCNGRILQHFETFVINVWG